MDIVGIPLFVSQESLEQCRVHTCWNAIYPYWDHVLMHHSSQSTITSGNGCMRWYWPSKPITSYNILLVLPLLSKLGRMDWVIDPKLNSIECSMKVRDLPWLNGCGIDMDGLSNKDDFWESSVSQWVVIICSGQLLWSASTHMACLMSLTDNDSSTNDHQTRTLLNHQQYYRFVVVHGQSVKRLCGIHWSSPNKPLNKH